MGWDVNVTVAGDRCVVEIPAYRYRQVTGNVLVLQPASTPGAGPFPRGAKIVAVGQRLDELPPSERAADLVEVIPFGDAGLEPAVAAAFVRFVTAKALRPIAWWRAVFAGLPEIHLDYGAWPGLDLESRRSFVQEMVSLSPRMTINGRPLARRSKVRRLLGFRPIVDPDV